MLPNAPKIIAAELTAVTLTETGTERGGATI